MLSLVLLLSSFALVSAQEGGIDIPIPMDRMDAAVDSVPLTLHFNFPHIQNLTEEAKKEFASIIFNLNISKAEMEAQIKTWAAKNGILASFSFLILSFKDAVNLEQTKDEQRQKDMRVNVTRALAELPAAIAKFNAIEDNKAISGQEANKQTEALFDSLKIPFLRRLLEAVSYPDYAEGETPLFTVNMATAKRR